MNQPYQIFRPQTLLFGTPLDFRLFDRTIDHSMGIKVSKSPGLNQVKFAI